MLTFDSLAFAQHLALFENIYVALDGTLSESGGGLLDVLPLGKCTVVLCPLWTMLLQYVNQAIAYLYT